MAASWTSEPSGPIGRARFSLGHLLFLRCGPHPRLLLLAQHKPGPMKVREGGGRGPLDTCGLAGSLFGSLWSPDAVCQLLRIQFVSLRHYFSPFAHPGSPPSSNRPVCLQAKLGRYVWEGSRKGVAALCGGGLIVSPMSALVLATAGVVWVAARYAFRSPCDMPECARRGCFRDLL